MSEDEACRRIHVARLVRRLELVEAAAGKTKAELQTLLAEALAVLT